MSRDEYEAGLGDYQPIHHLSGEKREGKDFVFSRLVRITAGEQQQSGVDIPLNLPQFVVSIYPIFPARDGQSTAFVRTILDGSIYQVQWGAGGGGFVGFPIDRGSYQQIVANPTAALEQQAPLPILGVTVQCRGRSTCSVAVQGDLPGALDGTFVDFIVQAYPGRVTPYQVPIFLSLTTDPVPQPTVLPPFARWIRSASVGSIVFDQGGTFATLDTAGNVIDIPIPAIARSVLLTGPDVGYALVECWS